MKTGDYVRTKYYGIKKVLDIGNYLGIIQYKIDENGDYTIDSSIIKSSPNIIDLIEVGDYVNGLPVERVEGTRYDDNDLRVWLSVGTYGEQVNDDYEPYKLLLRDIAPKDIKSIVTKEQFENMKYKVR